MKKKSKQIIKKTSQPKEGVKKHYRATGKVAGLKKVVKS